MTGRAAGAGRIPLVSLPRRVTVSRSTNSAPQVWTCRGPEPVIEAIRYFGDLVDQLIDLHGRLP